MGDDEFGKSRICGFSRRRRVGRDAFAARTVAQAAAADGSDARARHRADPGAVQALSPPALSRARADRRLVRDRDPPAVPAQASARRRAPRARRDGADPDRARDDRDLALHQRHERVADVHVKRRRPARDARPPRRGLPPLAEDVACVLHPDPNRRGAVADRERHRRARQRSNDHRHHDCSERHHGDRVARRHVPARLAPRDHLARVRAALGVDDSARRPGPPQDHHRAAAPSGRHVGAGGRVAFGVRDHARQDDGARRGPR